MARTSGSRNADYDERRMTLAREMRVALMKDQGLQTSMRGLAKVAGTSVATLKHYFKDRDGVLAAVMESLRIDGAPHLARATLVTSTDVRVALTGFLGNLGVAWRVHHVGQMHAAMLAEGLATRSLGPRYVDLMLEPLLQAGEQLLQRYIDLGKLQPFDVRHGALLLLSPVVLGLLHQDNLSGAKCRPLDLHAFTTAHVDAFLRAHPPVSRR